MDISKGYLKKSLIIIIVFMALITVFVDAAIYFGLEKSVAVMADLANPELTAQVRSLENLFASWFIPLSSIFFAVFGFALWLVLKVFFKNSIGKAIQDTSGRQKKDFADQRIEQEQKQKLFLHTLSILQREGRLLDFFDEDLNKYDDEQIGMAVRSIQKDCKKAVKKYIAVKPIYDQEEGDTIELGADFDPDTVKLIGNVAGEPPFKGVLKHRGWKAGKKEIPKLSEVRDATIITPAEVEIK
ncbi:MAG: DUF2760 domain-containing protein [Desulfobacteraceae bacterium]|nr:DUF2760 domain-containing protein [Desulfobacteraceae bacterium]